MKKPKPVRAKDMLEARPPKIGKCPFCKGQNYISRLIEIGKTLNGNKWFKFNCQRCARKGVIYGTSSDEAIRHFSRMVQLAWATLSMGLPSRNYSYLWKFKDGIVREGTFKSTSRILTNDGERTIKDVTAYAAIPQGY